ncbi:MAG: CdaR family protein [Lachnospiraceae bacterium]|jgi:YbbR domain-containing protein|nr:CdaR family protein [Lachnospiraceae bacterium]MCI1452885.1 CdaR family protein [Lachnospiraceae bacterium]MDD5849839.1 CdaR family protein [Bacillota bacterium]
MKNNKPHFFQNIGLRILSLVLAVILWVVVNNVNDPIGQMTISNLTVRLLHTNEITDDGKVYTVLDSTDVVPVVTVRASRSIIDSLDSSNIVATADVEDMTDDGQIKINYYSTKYDSEIASITGSIQYVKLSVEERSTSSFVLKTTTSGDVADGYQVGTITPEQNQIRVSGPQSVVESIESAVANVDVSGATGNISTYSDIRLLDADGNQVDTTNLTMNITSVKISVAVNPISSVPIIAQYTGSPAAGYMLSGVLTIDPDTVELSGKSTVLSTVQSIVIPAGVIDISGRTETFTTTVDITPYLPDGTSFADADFDGNVTVTIGIEAGENVQVSENLSDITLANVPEGYEAQILSASDGTSTGTQSVTFTFSTLSSDAASVQAAELNPTVDVGALLENVNSSDYSGIYTATVDIAEPDNATLLGTVTARIQITKKDAE